MGNIIPQTYLEVSYDQNSHSWLQEYWALCGAGCPGRSDMELVGVVQRPSSLGEQPAELVGVPVAASLKELGLVDVALLCTPTRAVPEMAAEILKQGINTVDSYDIHSDLADVRLKLDAVAREHNAVQSFLPDGTPALTRSACFDGSDGPRRITYTNFGPGMSMGHSVAVKAIPGLPMLYP